jgi:hypothetical protein
MPSGSTSTNARLSLSIVSSLWNDDKERQLECQRVPVHGDAYKGTNQVRHVAIYRLSKLDKLNKLRKHLRACATWHVCRLNSMP